MNDKLFQKTVIIFLILILFSAFLGFVVGNINGNNELLIFTNRSPGGVLAAAFSVFSIFIVYVILSFFWVSIEKKAMDKSSSIKNYFGFLAKICGGEKAKQDLERNPEYALKKDLTITIISLAIVSPILLLSLQLLGITGKIDNFPIELIPLLIGILILFLIAYRIVYKKI